MDEKTLRRMTIDYYLDKDVLYKRSFEGGFTQVSE
jgi:hypothetical protein